MAKNNNRLKAELPRGFADRSAADIRAMDAMLAKIKAVYERYGFQPVETPMIEYTEMLGKFLPDQDRPNEGVFSFQDEPGTSGVPDVPREMKSGVPDAPGAGTSGVPDVLKPGTSGSPDVPKEDRWLSLRYDLTAPLARYFAENYERLPKPYRSYRAGWVFRNEKPGPGRFRQFMQFDADTVGAASPAADAEMCMMAADALEALGIKRGQYVIKVNSRKVLDGVMELAELGGAENAGLRLSVLRAIDKFDRLGMDGVRDLLGPGRTDSSGDFTKGAGLTGDQIAPIFRVLNARTFVGAMGSGGDSAGLGLPTPTPEGGIDVVGFLRILLADASGAESGIAELQVVSDLVKAAGYDDRVIVDPSVVRGLEYYTGAVFEAELLFDVPNEKGEKVVFGSVGGGGRYDGLVGRFRAEDAPATGFSIGVSRLLAALKALGKVDAADSLGPVVVLVMDRERIAESQAFATELRDADIAAEMYLGGSGMKAQMKYADRRNAPCVVIQGEDERERGVVQIKDLALGKQLSEGIKDNVEWREERPGQFEVPASDLVAEVRKLLDRQRSGS